MKADASRNQAWLTMIMVNSGSNEKPLILGNYASKVEFTERLAHIIFEPKLLRCHPDKFFPNYHLLKEHQ